MLTDFQNSFTGRLIGKFATNSYLTDKKQDKNRPHSKIRAAAAAAADRLQRALIADSHNASPMIALLIDTKNTADVLTDGDGQFDRRNRPYCTYLLRFTILFHHKM